MSDELMKKLQKLAAELDKGGPWVNDAMVTPSRPSPPAIAPDPKVYLRGDTLVLGGLELNFQRTVRVPEGKLNSLPAGLGAFPLYSVKDFRSGTPRDWSDDAVFMPIYKHEAMWMNFSRGMHNPVALKVGAGNINAVSGRELEDKLGISQDYLVVPPQPWLDGWKAPDGKVYQFVAAELGSGETVEGQLTGKETVGGIQFLLYVPKPGQDLVADSRPNEYIQSGSWSKGIGSYVLCCAESFSARSMGLGRGGEISQKVYDDPHGYQVWQEMPVARTAVYMVNSEDFRQITGRDAPVSPITYKTYQQLGLPWFGLFDQDKKDTAGSDVFGKIKPVGQ